MFKTSDICNRESVALTSTSWWNLLRFSSRRSRKTWSNPASPLTQYTLLFDPVSSDELSLARGAEPDLKLDTFRRKNDFVTISSSEVLAHHPKFILLERDQWRVDLVTIQLTLPVTSSIRDSCTRVSDGLDVSCSNLSYMTSRDTRWQTNRFSPT